jgi:hypothetical protein
MWRSYSLVEKGELSHAAPESALLDSREWVVVRLEITDVHTARSLLLLALLAATAQGAEVYRSKNADGTVTYSDRPTSDTSEIVTTIAAPHTQGAPAHTQAGARPNGNTPPEAAAPPAPLPPGPNATELREQRQKNCDIAKEREQRYELSRRLYRTNDKGEREYLDDKAVAEARAKAAQDVKDWCG